MRSKFVDEKTRTHDWKIVLVIDKGHNAALVTLVERKTKFTLSKRISDETAETVTEANIASLDHLKPLKIERIRLP